MSSRKISGAATTAPKTNGLPRPVVREENDDDGVLRVAVVRVAA